MLEWFLGDNLVKPGYARLLALGSALGIACILVVVSLFDNYYRAVEGILAGVHPHVLIRKETIEERELGRIQDILQRRPDQVVASRPAIYWPVQGTVSWVDSIQVLCSGEGSDAECVDLFSPEPGDDADRQIREAVGYRPRKSRIARLTLKGVEIVQGDTVTGLRRVMDYRTSSDALERLNPQPGSPMGCLVERDLLRGIGIYDDLLLRFAGIAEPAAFRVVSTVNLGTKREDRWLMVTSLANLQEVLKRPGFFNAVEVRLTDPRRAAAFSEWLRAELADPSLEVVSWTEKDQGAFQLLRVLKRVAWLVVFSVTLVAAIGVVSTLSLMVKENRRKIAILRTMGLRDRKIYLTFVLKSLRIAVSGLAAGGLMGYAASLGLLALPAFRDALAKLGIRDPRVEMAGSDLAWLILATLALYLLVALYPAREACRIDPVEGLQS